MRRLWSLNLTPRLDPRGVDSNPCTMLEAKLYQETYKLAPLDSDELEIFKAQFGGLLAPPGSEERKIMLDSLSLYVIGLRAIKQALNSPKFAGLNPGDTELGFGIIRPQFTRAAAAYKYQWTIALTTAWADWLYETATNAYTIGKDFGLVVSHLKSLVTPTPFMAECRFQVGRTGILIPSDTRGLRLADTENGVSIIPIPGMILIPKSSFYARAKADVAGTDEVPLGGLAIGLGRVLKEESPATWTA